MWKKCKQGSEIAAMNNEPLVFFLPDLPFCPRPFFILSDTQSKVSVPRARAIERACEFWKKNFLYFDGSSRIIRGLKLRRLVREWSFKAIGLRLKIHTMRSGTNLSSLQNYNARFYVDVGSGSVKGEQLLRYSYLCAIVI